MTKSYCAIYQHLGYCYVQPTGLTRVWCYLSTTPYRIRTRRHSRDGVTDLRPSVARNGGVALMLTLSRSHIHPSPSPCRLLSCSTSHNLSAIAGFCLQVVLLRPEDEATSKKLTRGRFYNPSSPLGALVLSFVQYG
jgi:hypothetical protein